MLSSSSGFMCRSNRFSVTFLAMTASCFFSAFEVAVALFGRHLEADVQQLAEARIESRILLVVPQRGDKLLGTPAVHGRRAGSFF